MCSQRVLPLIAVILLVGTSSAQAQLLPDTSSVLQPPTLVNGVLTIGTTVLQPDDASTQEELPGLGHKFELFGSMVKDTDPELPTGNPGNSGGGAGRNEVIATNTTEGFALAYRKLNPGITVTALTNQIGLKYYFVGRTCGAGSPRVSLLIDSDGDGNTDFASHGHVNPPTHAGCTPNRWATEDLTDEGPRWEVTPSTALPAIAGFPYAQWDVFTAALTAAFPNHKVLAGFLVDDSCSFSPTTCGRAYYDLLTIENRTLEIWQDAVKK